MFFFKLFSKLPFFIIYRISDILFILLYYVVKYRKAVVLDNLKRSFPGKSAQEHKKLAKAYYRHMADIMLETFKNLSMTEKSIRKRVELTKCEKFRECENRGQSVFLMTSHQGNWEWLGCVMNVYTTYQVDGIYKKLKSAFFDRLTLSIRSHMGTYMMESKEAFRQTLLRKDISRLVITIADQGPHNLSRGITTTFLNQNTTFFTGTERMAKKFNMPVFYLQMKKTKRGYYKAEIKEIDAPPFKESPNYITLRFAEMAEQAIKEAPAQWLWSHRRWKHNQRAAERARQEQLQTAEQK